MYARDPGMVIDYSVTGPWVKGISLPESEDEFIFAFYMPTTTKILKNDLPAPEFAGMNLGEYLRACEASDHMGWDDPAKMQIVTRIQKNTVTQIENKIVKIMSRNLKQLPVNLLQHLEGRFCLASGTVRRKMAPVEAEVGAVLVISKILSLKSFPH